jgi:hypothetical protein
LIAPLLIFKPLSTIPNYLSVHSCTSILENKQRCSQPRKSYRNFLTNLCTYLITKIFTLTSLTTFCNSPSGSPSWTSFLPSNTALPTSHYLPMSKCRHQRPIPRPMKTWNWRSTVRFRPSIEICCPLSIRELEIFMSDVF